MMKNLFVGNLPFKTSEDTLRVHFAQFGEVAQVRIMTDRDTGKPRGFAFVEMTNDDEAERAVTALNGKEFEGRPLTVNEARPKPDRGFGNAGGGKRRGPGGGRDDYRVGSYRQSREPRW